MNRTLRLSATLSLALCGAQLFAQAGQLDGDFNGTGWIHTAGLGHDGANAVAVQPDGKIILVGHTGPNAASTGIFVERCPEDGTPDDTFAGNVTTAAHRRGR